MAGLGASMNECMRCWETLLPHVVRHPTLCLASMVNGMFNTFGTTPAADLANSRYVILAGANRFESLITPDSVPEIYAQTIRAFNLSEQLRVPVVMLYDEALGHLIEQVNFSGSEDVEIANRKWAVDPQPGFQPYASGDDLIPPMVRPGDGFRTHTTGLTHAESGFPTQEPQQVDQFLRRILDKLEIHRDLIDAYEAIDTEDADYLVVAFGITARAARRAIKEAREQGLKVGMFRPITLWPFPVDAFKSIIDGKRGVLVAEMNAGQLITEIERYRPAGCRIDGLNRIDGETITPRQILNSLQELADNE